MLTRLLAGLALSLLPLAAPSPALARTNDTIRVGADVDAGTLDPRLMRDTGAYRATDLIYDGLVQLAPDLKPQPALALSWENPEPTVWIFRLRPNVKFHDGSPFTAEDVVFTYQTILNPSSNAPMRALFTPVKSIEAVDPLTVKFTLSAPYAPLLSYLDIGIVSKKYVEGGGDTALKPVGAGPMKLGDWRRGSILRLEPNADYWGGAPAAKPIEIVVVGDNTARAQAFEAGDLDLIQSPLSPRDIQRLAADKKYGSAIIPGLGVTYLNFNTADPLLADPKLRAAIAMLVDQNAIVGQIYEGVDKVATSVLMPSSWSYSADIKQPPFNVEAAKAAFAALGWKPVNGVLQKDGKKLHIVLSTHSEDPNRVQAVEFLQATFQSAGVETELRVSDWPSFSVNYVQKSQHQIALLGWLNIVDPDRLLYGQLHTGGPLNWGGYSNKEVDAALDEGRSALGTDKRAEAYRKAATILAAEVPYYIVSYQGYQLFYNKALGELTPNARGYLRGLLKAK